MVSTIGVAESQQIVDDVEERRVRRAVGPTRQSLAAIAARQEEMYPQQVTQAPLGAGVGHLDSPTGTSGQPPLAPVPCIQVPAALVDFTMQTLKSMYHLEGGDESHVRWLMVTGLVR